MRFFSLSAGALATLLGVSTVLAGCSTESAGEANGSTESDMVTGGSGNAQVYGAPSGLHIRSAPGTQGSILGTIANGARIQVDCKVSGEAVGSDSDWDYVSKYKGYVSDAYITKLAASFPECGDETASPTPSSGSSGSGLASSSTGDADTDAIVTEAEKWSGTHETGVNCNPFSSAFGRPCEAWCSDFVEYVWQQAGMSTDGVTGYAGSFLTYGRNNGTLKSRNSNDVQPGDAVVWGTSATSAAHVAVVLEVLSNGDVRVMNGNYSDQVEPSTQARSSTVSGMGIAGFVSPVAQ